jgi:hypothetical protein
LTSVWWYENGENTYFEQDIGISAEYKLEEVEIRSTFGTDEFEDTVEYEDFENEDMIGSNNAIDLFETVYGLMLLLFILIILSIVLTVVAYFKKSLNKIVSIILIVTFIFSIIITVGFAIGLPMALKEDYENLVVELNGEELPGEFVISEPSYTEHFAGEERSETGKLSWGPSTGWTLMMLIFIMTGLCTIVSFFPLKEPNRGMDIEPTIEYEDNYKDAILVDEPEIKHDKQNAFQCPQCGNEFKVSTSQRPIQIRCPHCKVEGTIK